MIWSLGTFVPLSNKAFADPAGNKTAKQRRKIFIDINPSLSQVLTIFPYPPSHTDMLNPNIRIFEDKNQENNSLRKAG
jgi:hypothetical protein